MAKPFKLKNIKMERNGVKVNIDMRRIERNLNNAQYELDSAIMNSMTPFMPRDSGQFIQNTQSMSQAIAGTGKVVAAAPPYGRYLYEGNAMVDAETGKGPMRIVSQYGEATFRYRQGAKLKPTDRPLQYSKHKNPKAQSHWFEAAKKEDLDEWVDVVKKEMSKE